jgi:hypothetical protein
LSIAITVIFVAASIAAVSRSRPSELIGVPSLDQRAAQLQDRRIG